MSATDWKRPESVPMGTVWGKFTSEKAVSGAVPRFLVTDVTENYFEPVIQMMKDHFLPDEPFCRSFHASEDPQILDDTLKFWKWCLSHGTSLVCILENPEEFPELPRIVGCNLMHPTFQDTEFPDMLSPIVRQYFGYVLAVESLANCFEQFHTSKIFSSSGLTVDKKWRGHGIGKEIISARMKLGRALDFKITSGVFSSKFSLAAALKVGFRVVAELKAEDYQVDGQVPFKSPDEDLSMALLVAEL